MVENLQSQPGLKCDQRTDGNPLDQEPVVPFQTQL